MFLFLLFHNTILFSMVTRLLCMCMFSIIKMDYSNVLRCPTCCFAYTAQSTNTTLDLSQWLWIISVVC
ncbi:hypothetical protein BDF19DRAFT_446049 [Syncephalis fuscata]|nr:hypothetical protein BDF19DRAFT_446049 [Syncephalis fuscata]